MAAKTVEPISANPAVLRWARESFRLNLEDAAEKARIPVGELASWENGQSKPGATALRKLADVYRRPLTVLLLPQPPQEEEFPTDYRTVGGARPDFSEPIVLALRKARRLQRMISEVADEVGDKSTSAHQFQFDLQDAPETRAASFRARLQVSFQEQLATRGADESFRRWRRAVQSLNIIVMMEGMPRTDCKGFALWSPKLLPTIVVTSDESPRARSFTLFHEVAHLGLRRAAACLEGEDSPPEGRVEAWCNRFAGAVLVPEQDLVQTLRGMNLSPGAITLGGVTRAAKAMRVSRHVVALRLVRLDWAPQSLYGAVVEQNANEDSRSIREDASEIRIPSSTSRLHELGALPGEITRVARARGLLNASEVAEIFGIGANRLGELQEKAQTRDENA